MSKEFASKPYASQYRYVEYCRKEVQYEKTNFNKYNYCSCFFLFDPLLNYLGEWADTYSFGADMVLGMLTPLLFGFFIFLSLGLILFSFIKCLIKKDIKQLIPVAIFAIGAVGYMLISNSNSFWIRLVIY